MVGVTKKILRGTAGTLGLAKLPSHKQLSRVCHTTAPRADLKTTGNDIVHDSYHHLLAVPLSHSNSAARQQMTQNSSRPKTTGDNLFQSFVFLGSRIRPPASLIGPTLKTSPHQSLIARRYVRHTTPQADFADGSRLRIP